VKYFHIIWPEVFLWVSLTACEDILIDYSYPLLCRGVENALFSAMNFRMNLDEYLIFESARVNYVLLTPGSSQTQQATTKKSDPK